MIYIRSQKNSNLLGPVMPPEIRESIRSNQCLVYIINNSVAGFVLYRRLKTRTQVTVDVICVDKQYRRQGVAQSLICRIINMYNVSVFATCVSNSDSELFWSKIAVKVYESSGKHRPISRYCIHVKKLF